VERLDALGEHTAGAAANVDAAPAVYWEQMVRYFDLHR
jgi:hypothetical protein